MKEIAEKMAILAAEFASCRQAFIAMGDENRQHIIITLLEHYESCTACTYSHKSAKVSVYLK